jgi:hypothetical protein
MASFEDNVGYGKGTPTSHGVDFLPAVAHVVALFAVSSA